MFLDRLEQGDHATPESAEHRCIQASPVAIDLGAVFDVRVCRNKETQERDQQETTRRGVLDGSDLVGEAQALESWPWADPATAQKPGGDEIPALRGLTKDVKGSGM